MDFLVLLICRIEALSITTDVLTPQRRRELVIVKQSVKPFVGLFENFIIFRELAALDVREKTTPTQIAGANHREAFFRRFDLNDLRMERNISPCE